MQVIWSDRALSDLLNISEVIENNKENGRTFELNPFYRYLVYKGNKIFYTPYESDGEIYIIHINARGANFQEI